MRKLIFRELRKTLETILAIVSILHMAGEITDRIERKAK